MKSKKELGLIMLLISLMMVSCKKGFLEVPDKTTILKEAYVVDIATTEHYLNGVYAKMSVGFFDWGKFPVAEVIADNMIPNFDGVPFRGQIYDWKQSADLTFESPVTNLNYLWQVAYGVIRDCDFVIEKSDKYKKDNSAKSDQLKGQALAIRALMHFYLVNLFAQPYVFTANGGHKGVPYIKSADLRTPVFRSTVAENYLDMEADLKLAIELMPKSIASREFMNHYAAKALLARIYLFKEDFEKAKSMSLNVMTDYPLMTNGYPEKLYSKEETEALFRIAPGYGNNYDVFLVGMFLDPSAAYFRATSDIGLLLSANPDDKRKNWVLKNEEQWFVTKFPKSAAGLFPEPLGDYYQVILRSSEMCLTAAESYAHLNNNDSARYYLDVIRKRAIPTALNSSESGTDLLEAICNERRKEMAFDGLRMFDLQRWKKGVHRMDALNPDAKDLPYPNDKAIAPIPELDVELLKLEQNPSY